MSPDTIEFLPKQERFIRSPYREVLYSGAFGAAKTVALCSKLVYRARFPGARELLARVHLQYLKGTTLKTLLGGTSTTPPLLPPGSYTHHKTERIITIYGGGEIVYCPLDDMDKLGSQEFSGAAFDEATDTKDQDVWQTLLGRCRRKVEGLPLQIYAACNPDAPTHFLAQRFGIAPGSTALPGTHLIRTKSFDNPWLPAEYLANLRQLTGVMYRRNVLGEWVAADGLVYGCWDRSKHIKDYPKDMEWKRAWIGIDNGFAAPFAALLGFEDTDGRVMIVAERYGSGLSESERVGKVQQLIAIAKAARVTLHRVVCDSAAADFINALRESGIQCELANKAVDDGISATRAMLEAERLCFEAACTKTIGEIEGYCYKKGEDKVIKEHDHAMDALRYMVMSMEGVGYVAVFPQAEIPAPPLALCRTCDLRITAPKHTPLDVAIADRLPGIVAVVPDPAGCLSIYQEPEKGGRYVIGVSAGGDKVPTYAVAADVSLRRVMAELVVKGENVPRMIAGLCLWLGDDVAVNVLAHTPAGLSLAGNMAQYAVPVRGGRSGWAATERELADAIMDIRTAWADWLWDPSKEARADAAMYRWTTTRPEHAHVGELPAMRPVWADRVLARAALVQMMQTMRAVDVPMGRDPFTGRLMPRDVLDHMESIRVVR
ncbi:MAG: phage terminase large subunit [Planctomycetes bacterium]|nr:phage terminase large subunit [Planctomycetota bacterium]